ncbi:MAG TPA: anti-sigma factor antagonist [Firmicutes bacterium]|nr:anti-sigma factor antagonist [Bacillota bacterium]
MENKNDGENRVEKHNQGDKPLESLELRTLKDGSKSIVILQGELRHGNSNQLFDEAVNLFDSGINHIILDLSQLSYCDTAGLQSLVQIYKYTVSNPEKSFLLYIAEGSLMETLRTCHFDKFIEVTHEKSAIEGDWTAD